MKGEVDNWPKVIDTLAQHLYETMTRQVQPSPDWAICGWNVQPDKLKEDWRAVATAAWDYVP